MSTIRLTVLLAAIVSGASFGLSPVSGSSEPAYVLVLDTPEGIVERTVSQEEADAMLTCSIDSPTVAECTNGPRTRVSAAGHGMLLPIPSGFTTPAATVPVHKMIFTSILSSNAGTSRVFRCEVNEAPAPAGTGAVTFTCFAGSGTFPPVGSSMTQHAIALAATQGGASDTTSLTLYQQNGVLVPGLGRVTAQLTY